MNKENTSTRWVLVFVVVAAITTTLFLWQVLIAQQRSVIKQTIKPDAASTKNTIALNQESPSLELVFAGSGVNLPIMRLLVKEFRQSHPDIKIDVPPTIGSKGAIKAAFDGAIAIGLISRPLLDKEKKLGLEVVPYARTATAIATHPSVAEDEITSEELIQIYKGTLSRWRDGQQIIVLTREVGDSSILQLESKIPKFKEVYASSQQAKRWTTLYTDQEMDQVLAKTTYAIGLSDIGTIRTEGLPHKVLKFNGVSPTLENVSNGSYPLVKTLSFVFRKDKLPASARSFVNFVKSESAAKIMRANGYLPVK